MRLFVPSVQITFLKKDIPVATVLSIAVPSPAYHWALSSLSEMNANEVNKAEELGFQLKCQDLVIATCNDEWSSISWNTLR